MFPPKRILFPVDFSDRCASVAPMAEAFTKRFEAELTLLHVLPTETPGIPATAAQEAMETFAARHLATLTTKQAMLRGDPASEIVQFAKDHESDLIMMPTHGYGSFRRFLFGSVTSKVLHDAWCPMWTDVHVEKPSRNRNTEIRSVVCALDLSEKSDPTLHWAAQMACETGASLLLVHVVPYVTYTGAELYAADFQEQMASSAREQIACLQRNANTHAKVEIVSGEVAYAVRRAAEEARADLLVIGRSFDKSMIGRLRTNAYAIIRHSPCPVVSV